MTKNHFCSERWLGMIHFVDSGVGHKILVGIVHTCLEVMISPVVQLLRQHNPGWHKSWKPKHFGGSTCLSSIEGCIVFEGYKSYP